jgi:hypothetical protein
MLLEIVVVLALALIFIWTALPILRIHRRKAHLSALYKCFFIWFLCTLPVFASLAQIPYEKLNVSSGMFDLSGSPFSLAEQLIYASTFLSPALFVFVDALNALIFDKDPDKTRRFKQVLRSYHRILLPSLVLMLISMYIFASVKTDIETFKRTTFYHFMYNKSILIYLASLFYWYCVILIENSSGEDYVDAAAQRTRSFTEAAAQRLGGGQ